jgi:hypothetical protein
MTVCMIFIEMIVSALSKSKLIIISKLPKVSEMDVT